MVSCVVSVVSRGNVKCPRALPRFLVLLGVHFRSATTRMLDDAVCLPSYVLPGINSSILYCRRVLLFPPKPLTPTRADLIERHGAAVAHTASPLSGQFIVSPTAWLWTLQSLYIIPHFAQWTTFIPRHCECAEAALDSVPSQQVCFAACTPCTRRGSSRSCARDNG